MKKSKVCLILAFLLASMCHICADDKKKILFIAGRPSHGPGQHEHRAGCILLAKALNASGVNVEAKVHYYDWPKDESILEGIDGLVIYADAGGRIDKHAEKINQMIKNGMGIMFIHYGVHPKEELGEKYYKDWIGGYFDPAVSVNPHWVADLTPKKGHAVGRGVAEKFLAFDEFYYNMNFKKDCPHCYSLVDATPTIKNMIIYNNIWHKTGEEQIGKKQSLMWCHDPKDGKVGRGVGFTGGHYHQNWAIDDFRRLVLNTIVWMARCEVPKAGVPSKKITEEELNANLDKKRKSIHLKLPDGSELKHTPRFKPYIDSKGKIHRKPEAAEKARKADEEKTKRVE